MFNFLSFQPTPSSQKTPLSVWALRLFSKCWFVESELSSLVLWVEKRCRRLELGWIKERSLGCVADFQEPRGSLAWGPLGGDDCCSQQRYCSCLGTERRVWWGPRWWRVRAMVRAAWVWCSGDWPNCAWWARRPRHPCRRWGEYGAQNPLSGTPGESWSCGWMFGTRASPDPHRGRWSCGMLSPPGSGRKEGIGRREKHF